MYGNLFTQTELNSMESQGYVRSRVHPNDSELWILNYTEKAAYEGLWNNVTLNCRGLIVNAFGDIVARPFPKFFNYGQAGCPAIDLDAPAVVTDKLDGSLGILYRVPGEKEYSIATRGSFESEQALHATEILRTKYSNFKPSSNWTYLFEIVYPENRIVCDYEGMDDLVFLGAVHLSSGISYDSDVASMLGWAGPVAEVFEYRTMREALEAEPRDGKEGFVVHFLNSDVRVKIKQEDYIALHRIVTGLNARSVWEAMLNYDLEGLVAKVPDEFYDFVMDTAEAIQGEVNDAVMTAYREFDSILYWIGVNPSRKDFAFIAKSKANSWALFNIWDNKDIEREFLRRAKPAHNYSPIKADNDSN